MNEVAKIGTPNLAGANTDGNGAADAMPNSVEAEQQLLGALLTNNDLYDKVADLIGPEHFFDPVHARIFELASARISKGNLASPVT